MSTSTGLLPTTTSATPVAQRSTAPATATSSLSASPNASSPVAPRSPRAVPTNRPRFRLNAKNIFATWPQCSETKEDVLARSLEFFGDQLEFAVVCQEEHEDGSPHLHAVFALKSRKSYRSPNCLDSLANSHGNYQAAKSLRASVKYVAKDGDFISHGVDVSTYLQAAKQKQSTKATVMAKHLLEGKSLEQINQLDPGFFLMNQKKVREYQAAIAVWRLNPTRTWVPLPPTAGLTPALTLLKDWLNKNLGQPRVLRQKQLLLSSPPGLGKTTLLEELRHYFKVYSHLGDKWFDGYDDHHHQLMVFDEFNGGIPLSVMNKVLDGQNCLLQIKGASIPKTHRLPVIILTNYTCDEIYGGEKVNQTVRQAFLDRLDFIRLDYGDEPWRLLPFFADFVPTSHMVDDVPAPTPTPPPTTVLPQLDGLPAWDPSRIIPIDFSDFLE